MANKRTKKTARQSGTKFTRDLGSAPVEPRETIDREGKIAADRGTTYEFPSEESKGVGRKTGLGPRQAKGTLRHGVILNAIDMLRADHEQVQDLFRDYKTAGGQDHEKRKGIAEKIFMALDAHAEIEEEIFYTAVQALGDRKLKELIDESLREHREFKTLIEDLRRSDPASEYYDEKLNLLVEDVNRHIQKEEREVFPNAGERLGDAVDRLGTEMAERKNQVMSRTHPDIRQKPLRH